MGLSTALLWHLPSGELRSLFLPDTADFDGMAFSPDGRWLLASGLTGWMGDPFLIAWEVASGEVALTLQDTGRILCASFTPDGHILIIVEQDGIQFREMPSGQLLATAVCLEEPDHPWIVFTPGGDVDGAPYRMHPPARRVAESLPIQGLLGGLAIPGILGRILAGERFGVG